MMEWFAFGGAVLGVYTALVFAYGARRSRIRFSTRLLMYNTIQPKPWVQRLQSGCTAFVCPPHSFRVWQLNAAHQQIQVPELDILQDWTFGNTFGGKPIPEDALILYHGAASGPAHVGQFMCGRHALNQAEEMIWKPWIFGVLGLLIGTLIGFLIYFFR